MFKELESLFFTKKFRYRLMFLIKTAGIRVSTGALFKNLFLSTIAINVIILMYAMDKFSILWSYKKFNLVMVLASSWVLLFFTVFVIAVFMVRVLLNVKLYQRKNEIESSFSEYLFLVSSNIRAGMSVENALWSSIRPRFGILAEEMETVAKKTMSGEELVDGLNAFADKYESLLIKRAVSLLVEGMEAGGEIAELLNKIASDIQEIQTMRKEMAAGVKNYTIFITFICILVAPFLFALSSQLIAIMSTLTSGVDLSAAQAVSPISISLKSGITVDDFRIFALVALAITSFFSAMLISIISKGSAKAGARLIPIFMVVACSLFLFFNYLLTSVFGRLF